MDDQEIWRVVKRHYTGNLESILAKKIFDVAREVSNLTELQVMDIYLQRDTEMSDEIRHLKSLPPIARA